MASEKKREDIQRRVTVCQEYAQLWEDFFKTFGTGNIQERRILDADEARFAKIVTKLATEHFRFGFYMGDKFSEGEKILDVLERAESLRVIQEMPEANFSKLEIDWHNVFISMHRAVGRLMRELPPEEPEAEVGDGKKSKKAKGAKAAPPQPSSATGAPKFTMAGAAKPTAPASKPGAAPPRPKGP